MIRNDGFTRASPVRLHLRTDSLNRSFAIIGDKSFATMSATSSVPGRIRLLALDADGTLVGPDGVVRPAVKEAVAMAQDRGLLVVVCTGRRYRTARPILEELDLDGPVVVHNGVVVKDARTGKTTEQHFLPDEFFAPVMEIMGDLGPPLVYVDRYFDGIDLYAEPADRCHEFQAEYLDSNPNVVHEVESVAALPTGSVVMISSMADSESLLTLKGRIEGQFGDRVQTNYIMNTNYRGHILEVTRAGVSKWTALAKLCEGLGIAPSEIAAIGDDTNDIEMIVNAGMGIAMGNAVDDVKRVADYETESNARDGVARAIERLLS